MNPNFRSLFESSPDLCLILLPDALNWPRPKDRYWWVSNIPVLEDGEFKYILHRAVDMTEVVRMQDVLAMVSHDLHNPLSTIEMSTDLLKAALRREDAEDRDDLLKVIERSLHHMKRLVGDLLNLAKIESGSFSVAAEKICLKRILQDAHQSILHGAVKKRIRILVETKVQSENIYCDHDRIVEVLSNILGNAVKFSYPGGVIRLSVKQDPECFHFAVQDDGSGIAADHLPHLFDRYWQAKTNSRQGAGLGLAIARGIVLSHQGEIWVESKLNHGTTLHFTIPQNQRPQYLAQSLARN